MFVVVLCKLVKGKDQIIIFENVLKYEKFLVSYVLSGVSLEFESQRYPAFLRVKVNFQIVRSEFLRGFVFRLAPTTISKS